MGKNFSRTKRKANPSPVRITERDAVVIQALYRFTILTKDQLHKLAGGGREGFRQRLRLLYDAGFVERPPIQNDLFRYGSERPMVYCLGNEGAEYLRLVQGLDVPPTINWDARARDRDGLRGQFLMLHDLGANGAVIDLAQALGDLEGVTVLSAEEIVAQAPEWTQKAKKPFSIPTRYQWIDGQRHERNIIPDGVVGYIDERGDQPIRALLFVEFDQKMNVNRKHPTQSSIRQKIASYSSMFQDKRCKERFGFEHFRVLFITTGSADHLGTMVECCREYRNKVVRNVPPYPFFFSTHDEFRSAENPLAGCWRDGDGATKNITRT